MMLASSSFMQNDECFARKPMAITRTSGFETNLANPSHSAVLYSIRLYYNVLYYSFIQTCIELYRTV
eukprot:16434387-Heterocapsa_arctica.AAC.1